ncbi:AAA family ATPase [Vibrio crassostreae]|uniref:AAA family ATPase n=1 Tax=Vibrio crassostreae TaxID=246167 RepID=UPI001B310315|nr:AAA family ATPase [Vibrio crassostreae]
MQALSFSKENIAKGADNTYEDFVLSGLSKKSHGFLLGAPSIGKTHLMLSMAYECATGAGIVGLLHGTNPVRVLYVAAEDGTNRIFSRGKTHIAAFSDEQLELLSENLSFTELDYPLLTVNGGDANSMLSLSNLIALAKDYDIVFIDTIRKAIGTAREVQEDTFVDAMLTRLANEADVAVLCSHHLKKTQVTKGKDRESVDTTGGSGLSVTQQTSKYHLLLEQVSKGKLSLYHSKDNYVPEDRVILESDKRELRWDDFKILRATGRDSLLDITVEQKFEQASRPSSVSPELAAKQRAIVANVSKDGDGEADFELPKEDFAPQPRRRENDIFGDVKDDEL